MTLLNPDFPVFKFLINVLATPLAGKKRDGSRSYARLVSLRASVLLSFACLFG